MDDNAGIYAFQREENGRRIVVVINNGPGKQAVRLEGGTYRDLLTDKIVDGLAISLESMTGMILVPR
jgi:hypothetical protein